MKKFFYVEFKDFSRDDTEWTFIAAFTDEDEAWRYADEKQRQEPHKVFVVQRMRCVL